MNSPTTVSFSRAPSESLQNLLSGGFLVPLLKLHKRKIGNFTLDVHFRSGDEVHVYGGSARLLTAKRRSDANIQIDADQTYRGGGGDDNLFRNWNTEESGLEEAIEAYLTKCPVATLRITGESLIQDTWSRITDNWTSFDRESALHYESDPVRAPRRIINEIEVARNILRNIAEFRPGKKKWKRPERPSTKNRVDQLGVDQDGNLVLIELKDGNSKDYSSVFYSPLQILEYIHEWYVAFSWEHIRAQIKDLIDARQNLGLMPNTKPLTGGLRAVICFGEDVRSEEVKRRFYEALGVVNAHLPPGVMPVETWCIDKNKPQSL